jgi:hypothetical protein
MAVMAAEEKRRGPGRPFGSTGAYKKPEEVLSVQVAVRLTQDEKAVLEERAAAEGLTVSKYIHKVLFP